MQRLILGFVAASALLLGGAGQARADLIVNGGFESGSLLPGWTGGNNVSASGSHGITAHSGEYFLSLGAVGGDLSTSQTVTTVGQIYDLQFFYYRDGGIPSDLYVYWDGGTPIYSEVNSLAHGWVQHDLLVTGTGSDVVTFAARNDPSWDGIDDVSLNAVVPEPTSLLLLGTGLGALGLTGWRRKK